MNVRELKTGKELTYEAKVVYPILSPDENFVAFQIQSKKTLSKGRDLVVWDFRNSKKETIIEDISRDKL